MVSDTFHMSQENACKMHNFPFNFEDLIIKVVLIITEENDKRLCWDETELLKDLWNWQHGFSFIEKELLRGD